MAVKTFSLLPSPIIEITADGNLMITGWSQDTAEAHIRSEESLNAEMHENTLRIFAGENLVLKIPAGALLKIAVVEGSLTIASISGEININSVGGHLSLQGTGPVSVENVSGHCKFSGTTGPVHIRNVGGNLRGSASKAPLTVSNVGGNIKLLDTLLVDKVHAGGNIKAKFPSSPQELEALAGGNIKLWLPSEAGFELEAHSGGEKVVMQLGGELQRISTGRYRTTVGAGGPSVRLHAGGNVYVLASGWEEDLVPEDFVPDENLTSGWTSNVLNERVQQQIQERVRQAEVRANAASRRAEAQMEAARRKLERRNFPGFGGSRPGSAPPVPPAPPAASTNPPSEARPKVSDEERMIILNMLSEKKITAEEANMLLDALSGKFAR